MLFAGEHVTLHAAMPYYFTFNTIVYEPDYVLNAAKTGYVAATNDNRRSTLEPPLPVGISFWAGPGDEGVVIKVAAYEAATRHRKALPAFGAVAPPVGSVHSGPRGDAEPRGRR